MVVLIFLRAMAADDRISTYVEGQKGSRRATMSRSVWVPPLLAVMVACSGSRQSTRGDGRDDGSRFPEKMSLGSSSEKVVEHDLNHDKKPDVWSFSVAAKTDAGLPYDRLVRKELDINWDGRVDITRI